MEKNIKKWDANNRKNIKSIKENIASASNNTFNWVANGERYVWPAKEIIECSTLMLTHSTININKDRISHIISEQRKKGMLNTLYERANEMGGSIGINIGQAGKWKNQHGKEKNCKN